MRKHTLSQEWAWIAIALAAVITRLPDFFLPLNRDAGMFAYGGWRILHGGLPYADFWDNKLPGVFYVNAAAIRLFGATPAALVVFQMLYVAVTAVVFYTIAQRFASRKSALIVAILFTFYHGSYGLSEGGNFTESYIALPTLLAALLILNWSRKRQGYLLPVLAGMSAAAAAVVKQPAAAVIGAMLVYVIAGGRGRSRFAAAAALVGGALAVAVMTVALVAHAGILKDAIDANIVFNRLYFRDAYGNELNGGAWNTLRALNMLALPTVGAVGGAVAVWLRPRQSWAEAWFLTSWLALDLVGVAMGGRFYVHYFIAILPSTLLLTAVLLDRLLTSGRAALATVAVGLALFAGPVWYIAGTDPVSRPTPLSSIAEREYYAVHWIFARRLKLGAMLPAEYIAGWLKAHTSPSDTIYVWGWDTRIGFLAQRAFASRYLHMHPLGATGFSREARIRELARDIEVRRPKYIIDESALMPTTAPPLGPGEPPPAWSPFFRLDGYEPVKEVVARRYRPVGKIDNCIVYQRTEE